MGTSRALLGRIWIRNQFKWILGALFCLGAVSKLDTARAESSPCVLIAASLTPTEQAQWQKRGFHVKIDPKYNSLDNTSLQKVLKNHYFGLKREGAKSELQFSLTDGQGTRAWRPLVVQAPKVGADIGPSYECRVLKARAEFFRDSRTAIENLLKILNKEKVKPTLGETVLDLERSYLVHQGLVEFENTNAKARYKKILARVQQLKLEKADFFSFWVKVRGVVYGNDQENIDYCKEKASMTEALVKSCVNCIGETYLMTSLFLDAQIQPPTGWKIAGQSFTDHLRPVLYNEKQKRTYDMVNGKFEPLRAALFGIDQIFVGLWKGHSALRFENEFAWINKFKPSYFYRALACRFPSGPVLRHATEAGDLSDLAACDRFSEGEVPERTDNENKTKPPVENSNTASESGANEAQEKKEAKGDKAGDKKSGESKEKEGVSQNKKAKDKKSSGLSGLITEIKKAVMGGRGNSWFGSIKEPKPSTGTDQWDLRNLAETLIPEEKKALLDSIEQEEFTPEAVRAFSVLSIVKRLGFEHLLYDSKYQNFPWDSVILPPMIQELKGSNPSSAYSQVAQSKVIELRDKDNSKQVGIRLKISGVLFMVEMSPRLFVGLKHQSAIEKWIYLVELLKSYPQKDIDAFAALASRALPPLIAQMADAQRAGLISNLNVSLDVFFLPFMNHHYFSPSGEMLDSKEETPLVEALFRSLEPSRTRKVNQILQSLDHRLSDSTVEVLKNIDLIPASKTAETIQFLWNLMNLSWQFQSWPTQNSKLSRELKLDPIYPLQNLLFNTLTHPKYFFTVEATKEELLEMRPSYPRQIQDPEIRDEKIAKKSLNLPKINLPVVPGENLCSGRPPGFYRLAGGLMVECDQDGSSQVQNGIDSLNQTGIANGSEDNLSMPHGERNGNFKQTVREGILSSTLGDERQGSQVLDVPLAADQKKIKPRIQATRVQKGARVSEAMAELDPRLEVHLKEETWRLLLVPTNDLRAEESSVIKVLLHHAYRKKMERVFYESPAWNGGMKIITAVNLGSEVLQISVHDWKDAADRFAQCYQSNDSVCQMEAAAQLLANSKFLVPSPVRKTAYFQLALDELLSPKRGYTVFNPVGVSRSEEDTRDALLLTVLGEQEGWKREGVSLPMIFQDPGGKEYVIQRQFQFVGNYENDIAKYIRPNETRLFDLPGKKLKISKYWSDADQSYLWPGEMFPQFNYAVDRSTQKVIGAIEYSTEYPNFLVLYGVSGLSVEKITPEFLSKIFLANVEIRKKRDRSCMSVEKETCLQAKWGVD